MNYDNFKTIFDITKNKFKDMGLCSEEIKLYSDFLVGYGENRKLSRKGLRIYKKLIFKSICVHVY